MKVQQTGYSLWFHFFMLHQGTDLSVSQLFTFQTTYTVYLSCLSVVYFPNNIHSVSQLSLSCLLSKQHTQCISAVSQLFTFQTTYTVYLSCLSVVYFPNNIHSVSQLSLSCLLSKQHTQCISAVSQLFNFQTTYTEYLRGHSALTNVHTATRR